MPNASNHRPEGDAAGSGRSRGAKARAVLARLLVRLGRAVEGDPSSCNDRLIVGLCALDSGVAHCGQSRLGAGAPWRVPLFDSPCLVLPLLHFGLVAELGRHPPLYFWSPT